MSGVLVLCKSRPPDFREVLSLATGHAGESRIELISPGVAAVELRPGVGGEILHIVAEPPVHPLELGDDAS